MNDAVKAPLAALRKEYERRPDLSSVNAAMSPVGQFITRLFARAEAAERRNMRDSEGRDWDSQSWPDERSKLQARVAALTGIVEAFVSGSEHGYAGGYMTGRQRLVERARALLAAKENP
jgi:hypothetical protein